MLRPLAALAIVWALAPSALSQTVESPVYRSWANFKVGTTVAIRSVTEVKGNRLESLTTYKLVALDPKKAVVEQVTIGNATGSTVETAPQEFTIRRDFPLLPGVKREDIGKPKDISSSGEETITVAGKEYKAQWYESKGSTEAGPSITRTWISAEVPGKTLKSITRVPSAEKTTTMELVEIKTP